MAGNKSSFSLFSSIARLRKFSVSLLSSSSRCAFPRCARTAFSSAHNHRQTHIKHIVECVERAIFSSAFSVMLSSHREEFPWWDVQCRSVGRDVDSDEHFPFHSGSQRSRRCSKLSIAASRKKMFSISSLKAKQRGFYWFRFRRVRWGCDDAMRRHRRYSNPPSQARMSIEVSSKHLISNYCQSLWRRAWCWRCYLNIFRLGVCSCRCFSYWSTRVECLGHVTWIRGKHWQNEKKWQCGGVDRGNAHR